MLSNVENIAFYQIDTNCCFEIFGKERKKKWQILEFYSFNMEPFN